MSGPITCGYLLVHALLLFSARALREARAMHREYGEVRDRLAEREAVLVDTRRAQREARLERLAAVRDRAQRQQARLTALRAFAETLSASVPDMARVLAATMPPPPQGDDDAAWSTHAAALDAAVRELESLVAAAGGAHAERLRASLQAVGSAAPTMDDVLSAYALQRQMQPGLDAGETERLRATAARILGRLEIEAGTPLPATLAALAREIVLAPSLDRAEALATQLRGAVQREREAAHKQRSDAAAAREFLAALPDAAPAALIAALERVAAAVEPMDDALRAAAAEAIAGAAEAQESELNEAAALVLQESLRDLGYEVEEIETTLFAAGGAIHFRRAGWESYFVRMRVDAQDETVNFNVVRARGDEETAERRRLDALAEDRWCAEFPRLLETLASRGLALDVTRRLDAGEVPVQVVPGDSLPAIAADEDARAPRRAPLAQKRR